MTTFYVKKHEAPEKKWQVIDARGQVVGRLAARISRILMGKNKTDYTPHVETGDGVIVINAAPSGRHRLQGENKDLQELFWLSQRSKRADLRTGHGRRSNLPA